MAVRNEQAHLREAVGAALSQDYPGSLELVLAVAPSQDATAAIAADLAAIDRRVHVVDNPAGNVSAGLNRAIAASDGEVVVRLDGHAVADPGYVRCAVEVLAETGAANVGGVQQAVGNTPFERAVAAAMTSRFGVGDAKFHYGGEPGPTDTVYLGVFRREVLERLGGFDETLVRNQDYELNWRIRRDGGTVFFHPDLRVRYTPRGSLRALARQYYEYGRWKREVLRRHPESLRWRQVAPPLLLVTLLGAGVAVQHDRRAAVIPAGYVAAITAASLCNDRSAAVRIRLLVVYAAMHLSWAAGFLRAGAAPVQASEGDIAQRPQAGSRA